MTDDLISRAAALDALDNHAHGKTTLGGQTYRSITLEVAFEAIRALPAVAASQTADPAVKAVSQQSVRVKTLVWDVDVESTTANHSFGFYEIYEVDGHILTRNGTDVGMFSEIEAAKAAAQADYEARILAAIEPQPDPRDAAIARLVVALDDLNRNIGCAALVKNPVGIRVRDAADAALAAAKGGAA